MDPEIFRAVVLNAAIQGKLVSQHPNDEPASVLVDRIRAERQKLIKEGKIKKDKSESYIFKRDNRYYEIKSGCEECLESELTVQLPDNWTWVRFGTITINRDSERKPLSRSQRIKLEKKYDYYGASGVIDKVDDFIFDKTLLLIGEDGANLSSRSTPVAFLASGKYWVNNHAHIVDTYDDVTLIYLKIFINAIDLNPYLSGSAQPKLTQDALNSILVPFPPINEQNRICEAVLNHMELANLHQRLLNQSSIFYEKLKNSIFISAIKGRLVPQDSTDAPVQILSKNPIIKRDDSYYEQIGSKEICVDEELPYSDLPLNWQFVRLSSVITLISGRDLEPSQYNNESRGIVYVTGASNIDNGRLIVNRWTESPASIALEGDILLTCKGTVGSLCLLKGYDSVHIARQLMAIRPNDPKMIDYIFIFMQLMAHTLNSKKQGTIPGISRNDVLSLIIPLPPISEQKRIVSKLKSLVEMLDQLHN